jgi:hypothetical protein
LENLFVIKKYKIPEKKYKTPTLSASGFELYLKFNAAVKLKNRQDKTDRWQNLKCQFWWQNLKYRINCANVRGKPKTASDSIEKLYEQKLLGYCR